MKKILAFILVAAMMLSLVACGGKVDPEITDDQNNSDVNGDVEGGDVEGGDVEENKYASMTLPEVFFDFYLQIKSENPDMSAEELAFSLLNSEIGTYAVSMQQMPVAIPVQEGFLSGFDAEIKGFKSGAMFGAGMMGVAFVGYIFEVAEGADVNAFIDTLNANKNLRWNGCTEAEVSFVKANGNEVFFMMCPKAVPPAFLGEAVIVEPFAEEGSNALAIWGEFLSVLKDNKEALSVEIAESIIASDAFSKLGRGTVSAIEIGEEQYEVELEGITTPVSGILAGAKIKAEGSSFIGYILEIEEGLDASNWAGYYAMCTKGDEGAIFGAHDYTVIIMIDSEAK